MAAGDGANLTTINAILKEVYEPKIQSQLQNEITGAKRIEQTSEGVVETTGGKYVDFPVRVSRNTGIGFRNEGEQIPAAGKQGYAEVHVSLKYGYGRFQISGQAMQLSSTNEKAFAKALDDEMSGLKDDLAKDGARIFYGDGSGVVATLTTTGASATQSVDNVQYLEEGMKVDVVLTTGPTVVTTVTVVSISGLAVTFSASFTAAANQVLTRQGSYQREPSGLGNIIEDNTTALHTLDPATQPKWASHKDHNSGTNRALSEGKMIQVCDAVRRNGGKTSAIFTSLGVRRAYFNLLTQQRSFVNTKEFAGGFTGLPFNYGKEIPVVDDVDAPPNQMWFLDEGEFKIYRTKDWHYAADDGNTMKWVGDYDEWQGFMRKYCEMGTHRRNAHALLDDITEG